MAELSHVDAAGNPRMVDVSAKPDTNREAIAKGVIRMKPETFALLQQNALPKGNVLTTAQLAGVMAAKKTPELIPLCHPLLLGDIQVILNPLEADSAVEITATVKSIGKTGVEMEALTAVSIAALTIYDMCKAADKSMKIENIRLVKKSGGKSGTLLLE